MDDLQGQLTDAFSQAGYTGNESAMPGQGPAAPGVYIIRHGKTKLNSDNSSDDRIRGWVDIPLDQQGQEEALEAGEQAKDLDLAKLLSSDLSRATQTAQAIGDQTGLQPAPSMAFRPWNLGDLQGQRASDVQPTIEQFSQTPDQVVPNGESFNDFKSRFIPALQQAMDEHKQTGANIGIVTHFRNSKLAEAWLKGGMNDIDLTTFWKNDRPTASISRIAPGADGGWSWEDTNNAESQGAQ